MAEYPILKGFKTNVDGLDEFWSMVFASGGNLFDEELNPVFPDKDKTGLAVLEWMGQAMHDWESLAPKRARLRRARVDGPGDARLEDPRPQGARARRDAGARRLRQRPGLLHLQRRQRAPARQQPEAQQAGRRHQPDPLPRSHRCRQGADGLAPIL